MSGQQTPIKVSLKTKIYQNYEDFLLFSLKPRKGHYLFIILLKSHSQAKRCRLNKWCKKSSSCFGLIWIWKPSSDFMHSSLDNLSFSSFRTWKKTALKEMYHGVMEKSVFGHYKIAELKTLYIKEIFGNQTVWRTLVIFWSFFDLSAEILVLWVFLCEIDIHFSESESHCAGEMTIFKLTSRKMTIHSVMKEVYRKKPEVVKGWKLGQSPRKEFWPMSVPMRAAQ